MLAPQSSRLADNRVFVRPSQVGDVYRLAANLRANDHAEVTGLGLDPRAAIRTSYRNAILRRTAFVDGEIAAMWGLGGNMLSDIGAPWLMTAPVCERVPVAFVKVGRCHLAEMLLHRQRLSNVVAASYHQAIRFLEVLGFNLDPPQRLSPDGPPFHRFWRER